MSSKKRKYRRNNTTIRQSAIGDFRSTLPDTQPSYEPPAALYIQAYEADLVRGTQARIAAQSLEVSLENGTQRAGDGLIRWGHAMFGLQGGASSDGASEEQPENDSAIWVDRYDARLLLDTLPTTTATEHQWREDSPSGWSDLPSDVEDTFFLTPEEIESYRRDKRRRILDRDREARLKALNEADGEEEIQQEIWGGSDEEPDDAQKELMNRTAAHLVSSPNPAQLEMRILANHGADRRFAFLRGRWSRSWKLIKGKARKDKEDKEREKGKVSGGLGGLADYGDSDNESRGSGDHPVDDDPVEEKDENSRLTDAEEALKAARRIRAREWAEKRRESKAN